MGSDTAGVENRRGHGLEQEVVGKGEGKQGERGGKAGHAIAILAATVRSLSSLSLFLSKACCLQLSRFWQL